MSSAIPDGYNYWTPRADDLSEEGFGYFRGTWLIRGVGIREAKAMIAAESALIELVDRFAEDGDESEQLAAALESGEVDVLPERMAGGSMFKEIEPYLSTDHVPMLGGLEIGVAGLVYALSAVRCWPAASCRGHATERTWADHPVVYLAADRHRAQVLQPLVREAVCGFSTGPTRSELLLVEAESIRNMIGLGRLVLASHQAFTPRRGPQRTRPRGASGQLALEWET